MWLKAFFKVPIDDASKIYSAKNLSMKQMMDFKLCTFTDNVVVEESEGCDVPIDIL